MKIFRLILVLFVTLQLPGLLSAQKKDMTFLDNLNRPRVSNPVLSRDGLHAVYTISSMDWGSEKRNADIWVTDIENGAIRQMTFTDDKNESSPQFSRDGTAIFFLSDRSGEDHLYYMRLNGGEARLLSKKNKDGVRNFALSNDGSKVAYSAEVEEIQQLWIMNSDLYGESEQLTEHRSSVGTWKWSSDDRSIYFLAGDEDNSISRKRTENNFDVDLKNELGIANHIWKVSIESGNENTITDGKNFSDSNFILSKDGNWMGVTRHPFKRYIGPFGAGSESNFFLVNLNNGTTEKLTDSKIRKGGFSFSPDSKIIYYSMADEGVYMRNTKIYVRPVDGEMWTKLIPDEDVSIGSAFTVDGKTFYTAVGEGVRQNIFKTSMDGKNLERITDTQGVISARYDDISGKIVFGYSDPRSPMNYFVTDVNNLGNRRYWKRLTNADPEVANFNLANAETITWKSKDGTMIEGIVYTPHDFDANRQYPLIVQAHGGPASASMRRFTASHGGYIHTFTAHDYVVFLPNYRGSDNYGENFRMEIKGNYFQKGYEDIMSGVDYLIDRGIAHPDSLGHMGWSAGGHWSNWALVSTDRFKAISSGAGGMNWVSMYAQTDIQTSREFYFEGTPYDNYKGFWDVSPLKFIKNAKTPTLIHVVKGDPRVPSPQSQELYMALQKLGVPSEFIEYPGNAHGIRQVRYQMVKMYSEFMWFEKWIRGNDEWFDWEDIIKMTEKGGKK